MDTAAGGSASALPPPSGSTGTGAEAKEDGERGGKPVMVVLMGPPGSGKSTFAEAVLDGSATGRPWVRVCQDTIGKDKAGTKMQCLKAVADALKEGKSVFVDRCNLEREQRADFVKLGRGDPFRGRNQSLETYPSPAPMASSPLPLISLLFLALLLFSPLSPSAAVSFSLVTASSNVSTADASMAADPEPEEPAPEPTFLEEVVDAVSEKYDWDPDADVRVWPLDLDSVRVGAMQRYEFRARAGGSAAVARFPDEAVEWRHPAAPAVEEVDGPDGIDVIPADGALGFEHGVRDMELVGPVEVRIAGGEDGGVVELQLPSGNATYTRLKKILVADGIALKVIGAQKVSLTHPHSIGLLPNGSLLTSSNGLRQIWPLSYTCAPLIQVGVVGSVIIVVHQTSVSGGHVKTLLKSHYTMELLSDKCHGNMSNRLISTCLFCSVSPRLIRLEKILKTWFSKRNQENSSMHFIEAKVTSVPLVKFRLELERDITEEDVIFENISEWKTKPMVQRVTLDIIAKVENDERLKAISVKKVRNPFPIVDAASWSSLTSNVSFTKFLSLVLPPEPLLLDVKW